MNLFIFYVWPEIRKIFFPVEVSYMIWNFSYFLDSTLHLLTVKYFISFQGQVDMTEKGVIQNKYQACHVIKVSSMDLQQGNQSEIRILTVIN